MGRAMVDLECSIRALERMLCRIMVCSLPEHSTAVHRPPGDLHGVCRSWTFCDSRGLISFFIHLLPGILVHCGLVKSPPDIGL